MPTFAIVILESFFLPCGVATVVFLAYRLLSRDRSLRVGAALALIAGYAAADLVARGFVGWWPADTTRRLPWWGLLPVIAAVVEAGCFLLPARTHRALIHGVRAAACAALTYQFVRVLRHNSDLPPMWWLCAGIASAVFLLSQWCLLERLAAERGPRLGLLLTAIAAVSGIVIASSGWPGLGQACVTLATCLFVLSGASWFLNDPQPVSGGIGGFVFLHSVLVGSAHWFGPLSTTAAALLACVPVVVCAGLLFRCANRPRLSLLLRMGCITAPILSAATLTWRDSPLRYAPDDRFAPRLTRDICYVGLFEDQRVAIYEIDPHTGWLTRISEQLTAASPTALATDPECRFLFVSLASNQLASFRIDPKSGRLTHVSTVLSGGGPCYLSTDRKGRFLFCACYESGMLTVHSVDPDGTIGFKPLQTIVTAETAHSILLDPKERFAFVPHTEADAIFQFRYEATIGELKPAAIPRLVTPPGTGPRHIVFSPSGNTAYVANEGSSVTAYRLDHVIGNLRPIQTVPTLPEGYQGAHAVAEIRLHSCKERLYVSNRFHDSIAVFRIEPGDGRLTPLGQAPTEEMPWSFDINADGRFLCVAGMNWSRIVVYRLDQLSGKLKRVAVSETGRKPRSVLAVRLGLP